MSYFIIFFENREGLRKLFKHLTCILLLFSFQNLFAHEDDMNDLEISILTCSKGKELYSIFGHSAIRIKNSANGSDNVYDFGVFNSGQPFFLVNFINGNLKYTLEKRDFAEFVDSYRNENRGVIEQTMVLSESEQKKILAAINENLKTENKYYYYDFFYNNCATKIVDLILAIKTRTADIVNISSGKTFRDCLHSSLYDSPWICFGIDILLGQKADIDITRKEEMFLPLFLSQNIQSYEGQSLSTNRRYILPDRTVVSMKEASISLIIIPSLLGLLFILLFFPKYLPMFVRICNLILGSMGALLVYLWISISHDSFQKNWNLLWLNPMCLFLTLWINTRFISLVIILSNVVCLCFWSVIPQELNENSIPFIIYSIIINLIWLWKKSRLKSFYSSLCLGKIKKYSSNFLD